MLVAPQVAIHACTCPICQTASDLDVMHQHERINLLLSRLTEPQRRWYVGFLSQAPDSPGERQLARITGLDRNTIRRGRRELVAGLVDVPPTRQRQPGAGRLAAEKKLRPSKR